MSFIGTHFEVYVDEDVDLSNADPAELLDELGRDTEAEARLVRLAVAAALTGYDADRVRVTPVSFSVAD